MIKKIKQKPARIIPLLLLLMLFTFALGFVKSMPPAEFPVGEIVTVEPGGGVRTIARELEEKQYIASAEWFMLLLKLRSSQGLIVAGDYIFDRPTSAFVLVDRLSRGEYGPTQIRVTIPEGSTIQQIADIVTEAVPDFNTNRFLELAEGKEGYLFPDTYQVFPSVTPKEFLQVLEENFEAKVMSIFEEYEVPVEDRADLITLASIVEREAFGDNYEEHQIVAGILKRRMEIGMRLQVDATLHYLLGKTSSQLTRADLRLDSPYNTYVNEGLPPGPIASPGLVAIETTVDSKESPYLFYLHGSDGRIHYAVDHDEHVANKRRYLK